MSKPRITNEDFVVAYATAETIADVTSATGMQREAIRQRARMLRDHGVDLPILKRQDRDSYTGARVAELNALIKKHTPKRPPMKQR